MCGNDGEPVKGSSAPDNLRPVSLETAKDGDLVVEEFPITYDGHTYPYGRLAYVKGRPPVPLVLVHHNYAGLKQFDIDQACFLARAGYVGLATDLFKATPTYDYKDRSPTQEDSEERRMQCYMGAFEAMDPLLRSPKEWRGLMAAYIEAVAAHPAVAKGRTGAIGYCLGGMACLEQLRGGHPVQVLVTFHGVLHSRPFTRPFDDESRRHLTKDEYEREVDVPPSSHTPGCIVVIENGSGDPHVTAEDFEAFRAEMDAQSVDWRFNNHCRTPHGWALAPTCPGGGENYREVADRRSTKSMLAALAEAWPDVQQFPVEANACGTKLNMTPVAAR